MSADRPTSSYLNFLPAIFRQDDFLGYFLLAFEASLSQTGQVMAGIDHYFRPYNENPDLQTPQEFIPWLAGWVALTLRDDWDEKTKRQFIQEIVPLYRLRGTKAGLHKMLELYVGKNVPLAIYDNEKDFGFEPPAHFFQVEITLRDRDPLLLQRKQLITMSIVEQEKPAHTFYALRILIPTMRLMSEELIQKEQGEALILGWNTLLGTQNISSIKQGG